MATRKVVRSAKSGRFVKKAAAKSNPSQTVTETIGKKSLLKKDTMKHTAGTKKDNPKKKK